MKPISRIGHNWTVLWKNREWAWDDDEITCMNFYRMQSGFFDPQGVRIKLLFQGEHVNGACVSKQGIQEMME